MLWTSLLSSVRGYRDNDGESRKYVTKDAASHLWMVQLCFVAVAGSAAAAATVGASVVPVLLLLLLLLFLLFSHPLVISAMCCRCRCVFAADCC